ncbi:hypothetical protein ACFXG4_48335 [Nocardia sp. NPDC059246]|uniref:hypothetical protein n=1 Tax=unclassified Nocardia TaxID=2637762 RepID=UPI003699DA06
MKRTVIVLIAAKPPREPRYPLPVLLAAALVTLVTGELSGHWDLAVTLGSAMCGTATAYYKGVAALKK